MYADCSLHYRFHNIGRWFEAEEAWIHEIVL